MDRKSTLLWELALLFVFIFIAIPSYALVLLADWGVSLDRTGFHAFLQAVQLAMFSGVLGAFVAAMPVRYRSIRYARQLRLASTPLRPTH